MTGPPAMVMPVDPQAEQMATLQGSKHISVLPFLSAEALQRQAAVRKQQQQHLQKHGDSDADPSPIQQPTPLPSVNAQPDRQTASGSIPQTQMLHSLPRRPNNTRTNILDYLS